MTVPQPRKASAAGVLIGIRPRWSQAILEGRKTVELRRRFDPRHVGLPLVVYETSPTSSIVGTALITGLDTGTPDEIWERHGASAEIEREAFDGYFDGSAIAYGILLGDPVRLEDPIPLARMRSELGLAVPQSYVLLQKAIAGVVPRR